MFNDFDLRQQIEDIASQFKIFECVECAEAIKKFLTERGINGKHIKLFTGNVEKPFCYIYHEGLQKNISTNGKHEAILVNINNGEFIFDNIHSEGVFLKRDWLSNFHCPGQYFGESFQITEIDF